MQLPQNWYASYNRLRLAEVMMLVRAKKISVASVTERIFPTISIKERLKAAIKLHSKTDVYRFVLQNKDGIL